jgi:adenylate kinase family enzyme
MPQNMPMLRPQIHLTGASGSGVTTTGRALAARLRARHLDTDDVYWLPTVPPFREKRPIEDRLEILREAFAEAADGWVLSGSIGSWGEPLVPMFDLVAFVDTPSALRLERLAAREKVRYGSAIEPGRARHQDFVAFMDWASHYEDGGHSGGRTRAFHEAWLAALPCPVLRLDGARSTRALAEEVEAAWRARSPRAMT